MYVNFSPYIRCNFILKVLKLVTYVCHEIVFKELYFGHVLTPTIFVKSAASIFMVVPALSTTKKSNFGNQISTGTTVSF